MKITILSENYKKLNELILFIRFYIFQLKLKVPGNYSMEKLLWLISGFDAILRKVFAHQPPEMSFTEFCLGQMDNYFCIINNLMQPSQEQQEAFVKKINLIKVVKDFLKKDMNIEVGDFVKKLKEEKYIEDAKKRLNNSAVKKVDIKSKNFISDLRAGLVKIDDFHALWKIASQDAIMSKVYPEIKNSLIEGGYFLLLEKSDLKRLILEKKTYINLKNAAKAKIVDFIVNCIGLFEENEREILYKIVNEDLKNYINEINKAGEQIISKNEQLNLIRFLKNSNGLDIKENLIEIMDVLKFFKDTKLFYVNYDVESFYKNDFDGLDYILDRCVELLNKEFEKNMDKLLNYDLWDNKYMKFTWLMGTIWFRWKYNSIIFND